MGTYLLLVADAASVSDVCGLVDTGTEGLRVC